MTDDEHFFAAAYLHSFSPRQRSGWQLSIKERIDQIKCGREASFEQVERVIQRVGIRETVNSRWKLILDRAFFVTPSAVQRAERRNLFRAFEQLRQNTARRGRGKGLRRSASKCLGLQTISHNLVARRSVRD